MKALITNSILVTSLSLISYSQGLVAASAPNFKTKELKVIELTLIQEIKERTCQTFEEAQISHYAYSDEKKASDKKAVTESIMTLIGIKKRIDKEVEKRKASPGYNDNAYVEIQNINVQTKHRHDENTFKNAFTKGVTLTRGEVLKPSIETHSANTPLAYRITYCDTGIVRIQGEEVEHGDKITFDVEAEKIDYKVTGTVVISKSGWD